MRAIKQRKQSKAKELADEGDGEYDNVSANSTSDE